MLRCTQVVCAAEAISPEADYALLAVLENLGAMHILYRGDIEEMKCAVFGNLQGHINRLRKLEDDDESPEWRERKIRVLNGLGLKWLKEEPYCDFEHEGEIAEEWAQLVESNWAYIEWAMNECVEHPEYECIKEAK
jgi:hypothetical protein